MPRNNVQKLPTGWAEREELREKGQFWTPDWVARAMVAYVIPSADLVYDPACGEGAFLSALRSLKNGQSIGYKGGDIDLALLDLSIYKQDNVSVEKQDFLLVDGKQQYRSIVANPPYIRHHRLDESFKQRLRKLTLEITGQRFDGRAGLHIYFLIKALSLLARNGRLAFIVPADICEGVFASKLWSWICRNFRLEGVVTFAPDATPFPGVDTNAVVLFIRNSAPSDKYTWAMFKEPAADAFLDYVEGDFPIVNTPDYVSVQRELTEGLNTGLNRAMPTETHEYCMGDVCRVMRGIATGGNELFFMTQKKANSLGIGAQFLRPAIGRTRDCQSEVLTPEILEALEEAERPNVLLALDDRATEEFPRAIQDYLQVGVDLGLPDRALIKQRRPWYKMEKRKVPPFLFAYLGRRNARFIENKTQAVPLTGFLCIYVHDQYQDYVQNIGMLLRDSEVLALLPSVAKSYGGGAIKVEPRSLEKLPLPLSALRRAGLLKLLQKSGPSIRASAQDLFQQA